MLLDGNSNEFEDSMLASLPASPVDEGLFLSHRHAASPERPLHDASLSTPPNIHLQLAECGSPENCNVADDSESLPLEELFSKILEIKKQRDNAEASDRSSSPSRSTRTRAPPFGVESGSEKNFGKDAAPFQPLSSSSNDHLRSSHGSGFRSLLRKIKSLFHNPFRKSSKRKKSSTMDIEDKRSTRLPSVGQKTLESEGRASLSFLVDGARISSSFSIPLSIHNHERESQKFPFPFAPPFALSDLEPAVLANYLTALDSASARDSPYIDLISPLSFDTRALGVDIDFGGAKTKERAKSGPQIQKNRTSKDIKRTHSFSALPPESIQGVSYTYRPNGTSFSSMDLGNWRTNRTGCWKSQMSDQFFSQDENEPLLSQQNTPKHLRTNSQFSITFGVKRVESNESKKSKQFDDEESAMIGIGSARSEISDSGTVEEVVHGFEESNFTTFPVASTFVFDGLVVPAPETKETPHSMLTLL